MGHANDWPLSVNSFSCNGRIKLESMLEESTKTVDAKLPVLVFSTAPQSTDLEAPAYLPRLAQVARWSEDAGCTGILIYTDNSLIDPWLGLKSSLKAQNRCARS